MASPATGEKLWDLAEADSAYIGAAVSTARAAFARHQGVSPHQRAASCERIAHEAESRSEPIARAISLEQGKPLTDARGKSAWRLKACDWHPRKHLNGQVAVPADGQLKVPIPRVDLYWLSCVPPRARAWRIRYESPAVTTTFAWWSRCPAG